MNIDKQTWVNIQKVFITIAYLAFIAITIMQNQLAITLPPAVSYVFLGIIGVCLKFASSITTVETIYNTLNTEKLDDVMNQLNGITTSLTETHTLASMTLGITPRVPASLCVPGEVGVMVPSLDINDKHVQSNVPYGSGSPSSPMSTATHRDIKLSNDYVLRIQK